MRLVKPKKCDLCTNEETQQCVESCPTNALSNNSLDMVSKKNKIK
ncbi:hypothetical protein [Methanobrevibacter arboriphilus]|nr:hypothetical protein [Methanobrevibacter arboriphilus]